MGIQISKSYVVLQKSSLEAVEPQYMNWKKEDIEKYLIENPMSDDENYSKEDLIYDLTESGGALTFSTELKDETILYLTDLMNWLIYDCGKKRGCQ